MIQYEIIIYWSSEDQSFIAEVPGCIAHGSIQQEVVINVKEAIQLWIDTAKEFGDFIPPPKEKRLIFA